MSSPSLINSFEKDWSDHDNKLLQWAREINCKLNPEKLVVSASRILFFGHVISKDGIKTGPKESRSYYTHTATCRWKAVGQLPEIGQLPQQILPSPCNSDQATLQSDAKKVANSSGQPRHNWHLTTSERTSTKLWCGGISKTPIIIQVYASTAALGATLFQNDLPVAFTSETLTGPETWYSNIEREMLAVLEKFHHVWGHKAIIQTDHKPLGNCTEESCTSTS